MILKVANAVYVRDYILALTFNNGEVRNFDFATICNDGICTKLRDAGIDRKVTEFDEVEGVNKYIPICETSSSKLADRFKLMNLAFDQEDYRVDKNLEVKE